MSELVCDCLRLWEAPPPGGAPCCVVLCSSLRFRAAAPTSARPTTATSAPTPPPRILIPVTRSQPGRKVAEPYTTRKDPDIFHGYATGRKGVLATRVGNFMP